MTKRGYQHNFSRLGGGTMYNRQARERKAKTILEVLRDFYDNDISSLNLLDIGSSTGIIDNYLADHLSSVTGVDIDQEAVDFAKNSFTKSNLEFRVADAMNLDFPNEKFDIVACTNIYEHVPDSETLIQEIFRVLKPGGICYFSCANRLNIIEPHYGLPFLSIMPRPLAHIYMRLAGKGKKYHEKHLTLIGLRYLVSSFDIHDYTAKIINDPVKFHTEYMLEPGSSKHKIAKFIVHYIYWLCPSYIWILEKPLSQ